MQNKKPVSAVYAGRAVIGTITGFLSAIKFFIIIILFLINDLSAEWHAYDVYRCGARGLAAGGAFTAIADDTSAIYYNPAGLIQTETITVFYTMDAQLKMAAILDPQLKLIYQVPALLGFIVPLNDGNSTVIGLTVDSPFQRKIPNEFAVYKFAPQFSAEILKKLAFGINIGLNYATYARANSSDGWGWSFQAGFLYFPRKEIRLGLNYQSKTKIFWDEHQNIFNVDETFPDILSSGIAYMLTPKLIGSFDLEFQNWKSIKFMENGVNTAPTGYIKNALFKTIHPHLGIMFPEESSGAHLRTGFYTDSFIEPDAVYPSIYYHKTQLLWTIGIGVFAYQNIKDNIEKQVLKVEIALSDSYLTSFINKDNNKIETIQASAEYRF